jgi:hypothetical protein
MFPVVKKFIKTKSEISIRSGKFHHIGRMTSLLLRENAYFSGRKNPHLDQCWVACDPTPREQLTLINCWPYMTNTHGVVVIALPV